MGGNKGTNIKDRFFLGGAVGGTPSLLPGFKPGSVGETIGSRTASRHTGILSWGGDARLTASATLQFPLVKIPFMGMPLHGLIYGSAGSLVHRVHKTFLQDAVQEMRTCCGLALGIPLS